MRIRRHVPPLREWRWQMPNVLQGHSAKRWLLYVLCAVGAGYLTAYLVVFPAPLLHGHEVVPRVVGLSLTEATSVIRKAGLQVQDGGSEPDPTAPQGFVIWQDPPAGVSAPAGLRVTLVSSDGPPKIPVPDVTGLEATLAQRLITAAGLVAARVESVQTASPSGITIMTRPPVGSVVSSGASITVVVSRGAPTIPVPDLLGMSQGDARTRVEVEGLQLGSVTRRRTASGSPGTVIAQLPAAGTLAAPGTVVDIVVARSP
jgi:eukaryotic-like serine/threonine-protein kinase